MNSKQKISMYRSLLITSAIVLAVLFVIYILCFFFIGNMKEDFDQNEQIAKPNYEQKVESAKTAKPSQADKDKDYAPQDNNKVNPAQSSDSSFIYDTTISDLSTNGDQYNGQTVQVSGEVIGDAIKVVDHPDYTWICLRSTQGKDDTISVIVNTEDADQIDTYGKYNVQGTVVQILGTFNLTCRDHEGECDLHCHTFKVVEKGYVMGASFNVFTFLIGLIVCVVAVCLFLFYKIRSESVK